MKRKNSLLKRITSTILVFMLIFSLIPFSSIAADKTNWSLNGWRLDSTVWIGGLLFTYAEGDFVPMQLEAKTFNYVPGEVITVEHDYKDAG
ncbi:MAG: hypothetical protein Q7I98_06630, partial [Erysipelotrichaceae bacterium]|nr:hypothetical protein [Erysipelotrichaceae bacterium]